MPSLPVPGVSEYLGNNGEDMSYQQQPLGPGTTPFDGTELFDLVREFPTSSGINIYFATADQDIACVKAVSDARIEWCAPKASKVPWTDQPGSWAGVAVPTPVPPICLTPEPKLAVLALLFVAVLVLCKLSLRRRS